MSLERPESKEQELPPFYGLVEGIDSSIFTTCEPDPLSKELLDKGGADQRYAVVGWLVKGKVQLRVRPGFPSNYSQDTDLRLLAEEKFGEGNIVIAKDNQPGIVHDQLMAQVAAKEPALTHVRNIFGGSFFKRIREDGSIYLEWLNRSATNFPLFPRNPLALACHAYRRNNLVGSLRQDNYDNDYHLNRSIPMAILELIAPAATKKLLGEHFTPSSCLIDVNGCLNTDAERNWDRIIHLDVKKRNAEIQALLMRTLFVALHDLGSSKKKKMAGKTGQEVLLRRAFAAAQEYKIPLDFDYIPQEFKGFGPALVFAADGKYFSMVKLLLSHGARVNSQDFNGQTALHVAVKNKDLPLIKLLLAHQADPTIKNFSGATPLRLAELGEGENASEIVSLLKRAAPAFTETSQQYQQCEQAIQQGDIATAKKGIAAMTPENQARAFQAAVLSNNPAMVTLFLSDNIHLSAPDKERGFVLAVNRGLINSMKILESPAAGLDRANPEIQSLVKRVLEDLIAASVYYKQFDTAITLLEYLQADSATALKKTIMSSAPEDTLTLLRQLLTHEKLSEATKRNLIRLSIKMNNLEIVTLLAEHTRDLNAADVSGSSLLHAAVESGRIEIAQCFLSKQANIESRNNRGNTPLLSAAEMNDRQAIQLLLSKKAEIDAVNKHGHTALMRAAEEGNVDAATVLLENGANFILRDKAGRNALEIAKEQNSIPSSSIAELIESHAIKVKNAFLHLFFPHSELRLFGAAPVEITDEQMRMHVQHLPTAGLETALNRCETPEHASSGNIKITRNLFLSLVQELGTGEQQKWAMDKLPRLKETPEAKQTVGRPGEH